MASVAIPWLSGDAGGKEVSWAASDPVQKRSGRTRKGGKQSKV